MTIRIGCLWFKNLFCNVLFFTYYFVSRSMNKHKILSTVSQSVNRKLSANENIKPIEIWLRLNV